MVHKMVILGLIFILFLASPVSAAWWNASYPNATFSQVTNPNSTIAYLNIHNGIGTNNATDVFGSFILNTTSNTVNSTHFIRDNTTEIPFYVNNISGNVANISVNVSTVNSTNYVGIYWNGQTDYGSSSNGNATFEGWDFTKYTEVDPGSNLTVTPRKVEVSSETTGASNINYSINSTSNFIYDFELNASVITTTTYTFPFLLADSTTNPNNLAWGSNNGVGVMLSNGVTTPYLYPYKFETGTGSAGTPITLPAFNTTYYPRVSRSGTALTVSVFSNSARTSHVAGSPQSLTVSSTPFTKINVALNDIWVSNQLHSYYTGNATFVRQTEPMPTWSGFGTPQNVTIDISSWGNNYTNNQNLTLSVPKSTIINFNITNNSIVADYYNTTISGIDQGNNFNNFTLIASSLAGYSVTLSATNLTSATTASKTWIVSVTAPSWIGGEGQLTNDTVFMLGNGANITVLAIQNFTQIDLFNASETPPYTLQFLINGSRIRFNSSTDKTISNIVYYLTQINSSRGWNFTINSGTGSTNVTANVTYPLLNYSIYNNSVWVAKATSNATGWLSYNISGTGNYSIQRELGKPYLISPTNQSTQAITTLPYSQSFVWSNEGSSQYNIQIAQDSGFSIIEANTNIADTQTSIGMWATGTHYWRVRTYDGISAYGEWSEPFNFALTGSGLPSSDGSTGIQGIIYEVKQTGNVVLSGARVTLQNVTWSESTTSDANGYYLFKNLSNNTAYIISATKQNYETTTEPITTGNGTWIVKNLYMAACVSGLNCFYTQEYQTIIVYYTNTSAVQDATVTIYRDSTEVENKLTDSSGVTKFLLNKDVRYQATVTKISEGILQSEYFYTSSNPLIIVVGTPTYATPVATPHTNITTYNQTSTAKAWSVQNFTSQYLTSQIGLGTMGQGVVAGTVNWVVVGSGGWFTVVLSSAILAFLGILSWWVIVFFIITAMSLWVLTRT